MTSVMCALCCWLRLFRFRSDDGGDSPWRANR
nr:MAG TPA: hypothetical protein [Caudoviricetes sp.]